MTNNSREILYFFLNKFNIPSHLFNPVCSTLDKLNKIPKDDLEKEVMEELISKSVPQKSIKKI